jgi:hypothetical protein
MIEMLVDRDWFSTIPVAGGIPCGPVAESFPAPTFPQLAIASHIPTPRIQQCVTSRAHHVLTKAVEAMCGVSKGICQGLMS